MATQSLVSIEEYLRSRFPDLDREYVDGQIVERSLPDYLHAKTQYCLCLVFGRLSQRFPLFPVTECRLRVSATRFRIPDLAVFSPREPAARVPSEPPLIAIEIRSPDERDVDQKLEEYRRLGTPHVWLIDPESRKLYVWTGTLTEVPALDLPEFSATIIADDIWGS